MTSKGTFKSYGVKEATEISSEVDAHVEEIIINGFTIVENVIGESELPDARRRVDEVYERQAAEVGGADNLASINDEFVARCLLAYDDYFLNLATRPKITSILERILGDYYILQQQNAIINSPVKQNYQVSWHRDLSYQHFVATRPLAISALVCIDDFSEIMGGTYVLPASHKVEKFPSREFVEKYERLSDAKAGAAIMFDSMLFHRGGINRSQNIRRGVNHMYALPFVNQQINMPAMLGGKYSGDAFLSRFLGYQSVAEASVVSWRSKRLEKVEQ